MGGVFTKCCSDCIYWRTDSKCLASIDPYEATAPSQNRLVEIEQIPYESLLRSMQEKPETKILKEVIDDQLEQRNHDIIDKRGEIVSPILKPGQLPHASHFSLNSTSTPEEDLSKKVVKIVTTSSKAHSSNIGSESATNLKLKEGPEELRMTILAANDEDLLKMPLIEIESCYAQLNDEEERLIRLRVQKLLDCKVQSRLSDEHDGRHRSPLSESTLSFLRQLDCSFVLTDSYISDHMLNPPSNTMNVMDTRELLLNASDSLLLALDEEQLDRAIVCLTVEEVVDLQIAILLTKENRKAQLLAASKQQLQTMDRGWLERQLARLDSVDEAVVRKKLAEDSEGPSAYSEVFETVHSSLFNKDIRPNLVQTVINSDSSSSSYLDAHNDIQNIDTDENVQD